jgi:cell division protein ZapA
MPLVNVLIKGRAYTVACDEGEEDHVRELGEFLDKRVRELSGSVGQVGDARLL